ncbi:M56 family metallopeptidase [Parabacteroides goldsteinii]|uniref:TonB-dependent receptor plug domain-containing protein n=1 Tax=Parabacteroides goldsteinii TaxID=328812 RepID=A0A6G1ZD34_9BACT|nr:M56 family metallopeptidase [Parabacteroides goldsteinii]MRY11874.1 TonB-dependent receptor plug domain-containing protein [Parabacteroides goldsteinii]
MGDFFVYILKSSVCLAAFYLFYRLLLSRETFHRFNRIALLGVIILSVAIPFIRIMTDEPVAIQRPLQNLEYLLQMAQMQTEIQVQTSQSFWLPLLFVVYLVGCVFFFARFLYSTIRICRMIGMGEKQVLPDGSKLVVTDETVCPFSWMGYIVISQKDMEESGEEILTHEMAHIRARHSVDMLICSFCVILQWFNPAVWLLKQELENIHEYEADESVINHGIDAKHYQLLLIKKAVGSQRFTSMANSFNHSKLKKRITMMLKRKSNPWARLKYLYVLPLTAVAVVAFARPEISRELGKISSAKISEIVPVKEVIEPKKAEPVVEVVPAPVEKPAIKEVVASAPQVVKVIKTEAKANKDSVTQEKEKTENPLEVMQQQLDNFSKDAEDRMRNIKQRVEMSRNLILIDNEVATYEELDKVSPENIHSFSTSPKDKSEEILTKYNASDKQGVISVVTKGAIASGKIKEDDVKVVGYGRLSDRLPGDVKIRIRDGQIGKEKPLIIIDGVEQIKDDAIDKLNPNIIESISVLKDESSVKLYGERGKDGVILITTKNASTKKK